MLTEENRDELLLYVPAFAIIDVLQAMSEENYDTIQDIFAGQFTITRRFKCCGFEKQSNMPFMEIPSELAGSSLKECLAAFSDFKQFNGMLKCKNPECRTTG